MPTSIDEQIVADDPRTLRDVLGRFVTGVVVITTYEGQEPVGVTANSFTSVSLDPPLVLFCVHEQSRLRPGLEEHGAFAVNILGEDQQAVSAQFARPVEDRFGDVDTAHNHAAGPLPVLPDALAFLCCEVVEQHDAGDHRIVIGRVADLGVLQDQQPLAFYGGRYGRLEAG